MALRSSAPLLGYLAFGLMILAFALACLVVLVIRGEAQTPVVDGCMSAAVTRVTADITVTNVAGGVQVLAANPRRCAALLVNTGGVTVRCGAATATVTATLGTPISVGGAYGLTSEGREAYKCISTTGTSTTMSVTEAVVP